jgi:hypothetical protein
MESSFWIENFIITWLYLHWACGGSTKFFFGGVFYVELIHVVSMFFQVVFPLHNFGLVFFLLKLYLHCKLESLKFGCSSLLLIPF